MWKLIKADISYHRELFILLYCVVGIIAIMNAAMDNLEDDMARVIFLTIPALGAVTGNEATKYKKNRFDVLLPVPIKHVVLAGHIIWFMYWLSLMILMWVSCLISAQGALDGNFFWRVLALTGIVNGFVFLMAIYFDIKFYVEGKIVRTFLMGVVLIQAILLAFFYFYLVGSADARNNSLAGFFFSPAGALLLMMGAAGSAALYFSLFIHRKSYAE